MWHELKHIPLLGDKLIDHDVKDFAAVLRAAGIDWNIPGENVPDILAKNGIAGGENERETPESTT